MSNPRLQSRTPTERFVSLLVECLPHPVTAEMQVRLEDAFDDAVAARVEELRRYDAAEY